MKLFFVGTFLIITSLSNLSASSTALADAFTPPDTTPSLPARDSDPAAYELQINQWLKNIGDDPASLLWAEYMKAAAWANTDRQKSCELFSQMALKTKSESIYPILLIKLVQVCQTFSDVAAQNLLSQITQFMTERKLRRWLESNLTEAAIPLSKRLNDHPAFIRLSLTAAKLARTKENKTEFLEDALKTAEADQSPMIEQLRTDLYSVAPRLKPKPDDWFAVGLDAFAARDFKLAVTAFERVAEDEKSSAVSRRQAYEQLKNVYKMMDEKQKMFNAVKRLREFDLVALRSKNPPTDAAKLYLASSLMMAKLHWTEHQSHQARGILTQTERLLKNRISLSELFFIRGKLDEEVHKYPSALKWFETAIKTSKDATLLNSYLWADAWLNFKIGNYKESIAKLQALKTSETDPGRKAQQSFWLARSFENSGDKASAMAEYNALISDDPLGYYPLLAYRAMGIKIPRPGLISNDPSTLKLTDLRGVSALSQNQFDWLISLGEISLARQLLADEAPLPSLQDLSKNPDRITKDTIVQFEHYARASYFSPIFARIPKFSSKEKEKLLRERPYLIFPAPFKEMVSKASQDSGLWPEYILSIMRQESGFDPLSKSPANAYGLMQLLPSVAAPLMKKQKRNVSKMDEMLNDLLDPNINITIGAAHLRNYWNQFNGQFVLATGAYNAGPEAVKNWVKTRFHGDPLMFIEDIPYDETKLYVKLVLRNFINYLRLDGLQDGVPFPEWCLEGFQPSKTLGRKKR